MVKHLLEYTQATESNLQYSLLLVLGLLLTEVVRSWSLALTWALNYRTGVRLRGAILTMAFKKILKLKNIKEKSLGEVSSEPVRAVYSERPRADSQPEFLLSLVPALSLTFLLNIVACVLPAPSLFVISYSSSTSVPMMGKGCLKQPLWAACWPEDLLLPSWA